MKRSEGIVESQTYLFTSLIALFSLALMMERKKLGCLLWIFYTLRPLRVNGIKNEFMWGCASAAYQYEGAAFEDGRGSCIWDNFAKEPGKIFNNENANVADDSYHRFAEDLGILKSMGLKNYRMSISWTRLFPTGKDPLNNKGLKFSFIL